MTPATPLPVSRDIVAYGIQHSRYGPSGVTIECLTCYRSGDPDRLGLHTPLTQELCDLNRSAMRQDFVCDRCGTVLSSLESVTPGCDCGQTGVADPEYHSDDCAWRTP